MLRHNVRRFRLFGNDKLGRVVHCIAGILGSLNTRYVVHSNRSVSEWVGTGSDRLTDTPKDLLVTCCETNLRESHEILCNQASNVNGTRPDTHARVDFISSLNTVGYGNHVTEISQP